GAEPPPLLAGRVVRYVVGPPPLAVVAPTRAGDRGRPAPPIARDAEGGPSRVWTRREERAAAIAPIGHAKHFHDAGRGCETRDPSVGRGVQPSHRARQRVRDTGGPVNRLPVS